MSDNSANSKRIAKNTLLLYVRMLFLMLISLYTSRVILNALGVDDYGIYNVVGGFVTMFSLLSSSLSSAISRFITFELGKKDEEKLKQVFSSSVTIQFGLSLIVLIIAETVGLWFLNCKMVIPEDRLVAANWCFQFSILTFVVNLISVPYNAAIIAHEKMSAFAYISILEALGKLIVAWCIVINPIDRLIFYAALIALIAWIIRIIYTTYCKRHFVECTYHFVYDYQLLKQMFSFAGWNFFGTGSWLLMTQGINVLMNIYFGVTVNAARGIATQVDHAVMSFVNNFTTAINPQITKSYASDKKEYMFNLMFKGAKFSYFFILFFAVPILCETEMILKLWLKIVPDYTVSFIRLTLIISMIYSISLTMITAMSATGDIKKYQIRVGGIGMLVFPMAWVLFLLGFPPEVSYLSMLFIYVIQFLLRLYLLREKVGMSITHYLREVFLKVILTTIFSFSLPICLCSILEQTYTRFFVLLVTSTLFTIFIIFYIGLNKEERSFLLIQLRNKFNTKHSSIK